MRRTHKILLWLNVFWVALTCLSLLAPYVDPQSIWQFGFFGMAFPIFLVGNILFVIIWSFLSNKYIFLSILCLLLGWNAFRGFFGLSISSAGERAVDEITLLTYNLQHLRGLKKVNGIPQQEYNYHTIKKVLLDQNADILGLQEISNLELERIIDTLVHPYHFSIPNNNTQIISKYPILNGGGMTFKKSSNSYLWADVKMQQGTFRLVNIHLQSNKVSDKTDQVFSNEFSWAGISSIMSKIKKSTHQRVGQGKELSTFISRSPHPIIICGDFNDSPQSYIYKMFTQELTDSFKKRGWGVGTTYAGKIPGLRIDYILSSDAFEVVNSEVPKVKFSDHYPVKSVLKWK